MELLAWIIAGVATITTVLLAVRLRAANRRHDRSESQFVRDTAAERSLATSDERARIAREMHDVVAHTLSVVVAQADGGRFAAKNNPALAAHALETIADVGRSALTEMRALLGVLRASDSSASMGPQPSLDDIPALVASTRERGLAVSYVTTGTSRPMPIGAGLAVYRIVQEALTNVLKHAGPAVTAFVQLQWDADAVTVTVSDDGRGAAARGDGAGGDGAGGDGAGLGLEGMRERTTIFGGTLTAGPKAGGGYVVRARLPLGTRIGAGAIARSPVNPDKTDSATEIKEK